MQRLRTHFGKYDGLLEQLKKKYEQAVKSKSLITLERDKLRTMVNFFLSNYQYVLRFTIIISGNHENFFAKNVARKGGANDRRQSSINKLQRPKIWEKFHDGGAESRSSHFRM